MVTALYKKMDLLGLNWNIKILIDGVFCGTSGSFESWEDALEYCKKYKVKKLEEIGG